MFVILDNKWLTASESLSCILFLFCILLENKYFASMQPYRKWNKSKSVDGSVAD